MYIIEILEYVEKEIIQIYYTTIQKQVTLQFVLFTSIIFFMFSHSLNYVFEYYISYLADVITMFHVIRNSF